MANIVENEIARHEPVLDEIVRKLVEVYSPERIYLFGSRARGDAGPDSDYDLLVVVPDGTPQRLRDGRVGYAAVGNIDLSKDILVCTNEYFHSRLHLKASFPSTVVREGKLLYAA